MAYKHTFNRDQNYLVHFNPNHDPKNGRFTFSKDDAINDFNKRVQDAKNDDENFPTTEQIINRANDLMNDYEKACNNIHLDKKSANKILDRMESTFGISDDKTKSRYQRIKDMCDDDEMFEFGIFDEIYDYIHDQLSKNKELGEKRDDFEEYQQKYWKNRDDIINSWKKQYENSTIKEGKGLFSKKVDPNSLLTELDDKNFDSHMASYIYRHFDDYWVNDTDYMHDTYDRLTKELEDLEHSGMDEDYLEHFNKNHDKKNGRFTFGDGNGDGIYGKANPNDYRTPELDKKYAELKKTGVTEVHNLKWLHDDDDAEKVWGKDYVKSATIGISALNKSTSWDDSEILDFIEGKTNNAHKNMMFNWFVFEDQYPGYMEIACLVNKGWSKEKIMDMIRTCDHDFLEKNSQFEDAYTGYPNNKDWGKLFDEAWEKSPYSGTYSLGETLESGTREYIDACEEAKKNLKHSGVDNMDYLMHFNKNHSKANGQFISGDGDGDGIANDHAHRGKKGQYSAKIENYHKGTLFKDPYYIDKKGNKRSYNTYKDMPYDAQSRERILSSGTVQVHTHGGIGAGVLATAAVAAGTAYVLKKIRSKGEDYSDGIDPTLFEFWKTNKEASGYDTYGSWYANYYERR